MNMQGVEATEEETNWMIEADNAFGARYTASITREGSAELMEALADGDFFTAPASTRFHLAVPGGLAMHSVHVYDNLMDLRGAYYAELGGYSEETIAIVALLHDVCKMNCYKPVQRNGKNQETGRWEQVRSYEYDEALPLGHGEKSLYIISKYMRLTDDEAMAIRWHMGAYADGDKVRTMSNALDKCPLAMFLQFADMMATHLDENERAQ